MIGVTIGLASFTANLGSCVVNLQRSCVSTGTLRWGLRCGLVTSCHVSVAKGHVYVSLPGVPVRWHVTVLAQCFIPTAREIREEADHGLLFSPSGHDLKRWTASPREGERTHVEERARGGPTHLVLGLCPQGLCCGEKHGREVPLTPKARR